MDINQLIAQSSPGGCLTLPSGEFEGPLIVNRPLHLIGKNTTIWAKKGSVIEVTAGGAVLENIRVELTEGDLSDGSAAIIASAPTAVKNVEVLGAVRGFGAEDGNFDVPRTIELGEFQSESENTFLLTVNVPADTEIQCGTAGIKFNPSTLKAGRNELTVTVSGISAQMFLYAEVLFKSQFTRRVYLSGRPKPSAERVVGKQIFTAAECTESPIITIPQSPQATDVISPDSQNSLLPPLEMSRGQRVALDKYVGTKFQIYFTCEKPAGMEIDPYVFLLDENERSPGDDSLIFFGNESSPHGEAVYFPNDGHIEVSIAKIDYHVRKIAVAYSIYAGSASNCFSLVRNPRVSIRTDAERISFTMDGLKNEATVVALEFYLYKGEWKVSAVGAGFNDGMAKLCNRYGLEVEG